MCQVDMKMDDFADGAQLAAELMKMSSTNPERIEAGLLLLGSPYRSLFVGFSGQTREYFVMQLLTKKDRMMKYDGYNPIPYYGAGVGVAKELMKMSLTEDEMAKVAVKLLYSPHFLPLFWAFTGTARKAFVKQLII